LGGSKWSGQNHKNMLIHVTGIDMNRIDVYHCDMKSEKAVYDNTNRQLEAEKSRQEIIRAVTRLWKEQPTRDITLQLVAREAGVTTRTILRKFGSREGLLSETMSQEAARISAERGKATPGDVKGILKALLDSYEYMGELALRNIRLEGELEMARRIGESGRKVHREWCIRMFAQFLPDSASGEYEVRLASFIAATEIYLWKLLRKDMKMSKGQVFEVFRHMVEGLIHNEKERSL